MSFNVLLYFCLFWKALTAVPSLLQIICMPFCPESPRFLLIDQEDEQSAREVLIRLRGTDDVGEELEMIQNEALAAKSEQHVSVIGIFTTTHLRRAMILGIVLHLSQQLCGINNIFYYSSTLFKEVGLSDDDSRYATLGVGAILVVMTIVSIPFMENAGRRILQLTGLTGIFVSSIVFTITLSLRNEVTWFSYFSIASAMTFVLFFAIGPGGIPWMMIAELFSHGPRSSAVAIGVAVNWSANFAVGLLFPTLLENLKNYIFIPFSVITLLCLVYLYFFMIETKGRSIQEITDILMGNPPSQAYANSQSSLAPLNANSAAYGTARQNESKI